MNLTFDDQLVLDNLEAVTLTSTRRNSENVSIEVPHVSRYPGLTQEAALSFGVCTGADFTWTIQLSEVSDFGSLKPRDTITDSDGLTHRILTASKSTLANFWRVTTRVIAIAADLCDRCDIYKPRDLATDQDDAGNREPVFLPYKQNVACRFQETGRQFSEVFGKRVLEINYDLILEDSIDIDDEDQIRSNGRIYDVLSYQDIDRLDAPSRAQVVYRGF